MRITAQRYLQNESRSMSSQLARRRELARIARKQAQTQATHISTSCTCSVTTSCLLHTHEAITDSEQRSYTAMRRRESELSRVIVKRKLHHRRASRTFATQRELDAASLSHLTRDAESTKAVVASKRNVTRVVNAHRVSALAVVDVSDATRLAATQRDLVMCSHSLHSVDCVCAES